MWCCVPWVFFQFTKCPSLGSAGACNLELSAGMNMKSPLSQAKGQSGRPHPCSTPGGSGRACVSCTGDARDSQTENFISGSQPAVGAGGRPHCHATHSTDRQTDRMGTASLPATQWQQAALSAGSGGRWRLDGEDQSPPTLYDISRDTEGPLLSPDSRGACSCNQLHQQTCHLLPRRRWPTFTHSKEWPGLVSHGPGVSTGKGDVGSGSSNSHLQWQKAALSSPDGSAEMHQEAISIWELEGRPRRATSILQALYLPCRSSGVPRITSILAGNATRDWVDSHQHWEARHEMSSVVWFHSCDVRVGKLIEMEHR